MSVALSAERFYTREECHRWYATQPKGRFERVDGRIVAMSLERIAHVRAKQAVYQALAQAIAAAGIFCEALGDEVTVQVGECDYEPDALVNCGEKLDGNAIAASNPFIIVEVLLPSTSATDTGGKLADYFRLPSVQHYLIVHATRRQITHHRRVNSGIATRIVPSGAIRMDPPGIAVSVEAIYAHLG